MISLTACSKAPSVQDCDGKSINLSDYKNKWVVLNYWADWCESCLIELPELNKLAKGQSDKLVVIGVNFDGLSNAELKKFRSTLQLDLPLLSQFPKEQLGITEITTLPVTFLISPQGKLVKTLYGPQTQLSILQALNL